MSDSQQEVRAGPSGPVLLRAIGEALYGAYWQNQLAAALDVNRVSIQRWLRGEWRPRPGVWVELESLLIERAAVQQGLIEAIRACPWLEQGARGTKELSAPPESAAGENRF